MLSIFLRPYRTERTIEDLTTKTNKSWYIQLIQKINLTFKFISFTSFSLIITGALPYIFKDELFNYRFTTRDLILVGIRRGIPSYRWRWNVESATFVAFLIVFQTLRTENKKFRWFSSRCSETFLGCKCQNPEDYVTTIWMSKPAPLCSCRSLCVRYVPQKVLRHPGALPLLFYTKSTSSRSPFSSIFHTLRIPGWTLQWLRVNEPKKSMGFFGSSKWRHFLMGKSDSWGSFFLGVFLGLGGKQDRPVFVDLL